MHEIPVVLAPSIYLIGPAFYPRENVISHHSDLTFLDLEIMSFNYHEILKHLYCVYVNTPLTVRIYTCRMSWINWKLTQKN